MAIREGHREQMQLLPPSIEEYVTGEAPVRVYDAFVEAIDMEKLGIAIDPTREGNPCYDPKAMLKLLIYGYSYGVRSSRKLERETHYNLSFIWLMGGLRPDHKTIAEFRRKNKEALRQALIQSVRLCLNLDLIAGNVLFVDGSKIRGNASIKNTWDEKKCQQVLEKAEKRIAQALDEAETLDAEEAGQPSLVEVSKKLEDGRNLKRQVEEIMAELGRGDKKNLNTVDKDCVRVNNFQGSGAGYNGQVVVDDRHGLIVSCDAVAANNDLGQFSVQIEQAREVLGKPPETAVADSGYAFIEDLSKIDEQQIQIIVPTQRLASGRDTGEFDKRNFHYDKEADCYYCPLGHKLAYHGLNRKRFGRVYIIEKDDNCLSCINYGKCTRAKKGRTIIRLGHEELQERLEREHQLDHIQAIYKRRQEKVELVFGHIKRNLGVSSFLLRGFSGVRAEMAVLSLCFNIRRMITLLGQEELIKKLRARPLPLPVAAFLITKKYLEHVAAILGLAYPKNSCNTV
jgi:transposase